MAQRSAIEPQTLPRRHEVLPARQPGSTISVIAIGALIVAALYVGREVFVPVALAILLSFVLSPLIRLLQLARLPRGVAVVSVVLLAFAAIFALAGLMASQVTELATDLPRYQHTIRAKIASIRGSTAGSGALERAADVLQDLGKELQKPKEGESADVPAPPATGAPAGPAKPILVEVRQPDPGALRTIAGFISPLLHPLATTGIVAVFVMFILFQREDLRNRIIRLAGSRDLQKTTAALDDAAARLSRLFLIQLAVNACFGLVIGTGLWLIGVPSPALWGILAGIFRFVPYVGAFISAAFPLALAAAVDPGWSMLLWTAALFIGVEPLVGHVIEPLVYGHSTGLSPFAVVTSAAFWTWLWGPVGLVLATPLTVCLVVLGRHVERLEFLDVMFGDRPALSPAELFYQRMLSGDPAEVSELAEDLLKQRSLTSYYDTVALQGLRLAQIDAARGALEPERQERIRDTVMDVVEDLADHTDETPPEPAKTLPEKIVDALPEKAVAAIAPDKAAASASQKQEKGSATDDLPVLSEAELDARWRASPAVLCIAGQSPLDEAAAMILAQLLSKHGLSAQALPASALMHTKDLPVEASSVALVCLSYLNPESTAHMRYRMRRLRRKLPGARVMVGCWGMPDAVRGDEMQAAVKADLFATTLRGALEQALAEARASEPRATTITENAA